MKLTYTLAIALLLPALTHAKIEEDFMKSPQKCGEYKVSGVVRFDKGLKILVHEKTLSQIVISFKGHKSMVLASYLDSPIYANVLLKEKFMDVTSLLSESIEGKVSLRVPDPLNPSSTGFKLLKELPCN